MEDERKASRMRSQRTLHRSRAARVGFRYRTPFFVILLCAGLVVGTITMVRPFRNQTSAAGLAAYDRTARVTHSLLDGEFCRYIVFDNKAAQINEDRSKSLTAMEVAACPNRIAWRVSTWAAIEAFAACASRPRRPASANQV